MPVYGLKDPLVLKLLTRLRFDFSHLREHKYGHNFGDTLVTVAFWNLNLHITSSYAVPLIPS